MIRDDLGNRMKKYEKMYQHYLKLKSPVIVRLDMRAGHSFCKGFKRPFDDLFIKSMQQTAQYLCENIQGVVISYQQSDEISLVLVDYNKPETSAWFDNRQNKIETISASMATMAFNKFFRDNVSELFYATADPIDVVDLERDRDYERCVMVYMYKEDTAMFDARAFNIPKEEVTNYIYWRQLDATRNSIQMVGQANFSHKQLQNKSCSDIKEMLITQKDINWDDFPTYQKYGSCCIKEQYFVECEDGKQIKYEDGCSDPYEDDCVKGVYRNRWIIDKNIPVFRGTDREYIDKLVFV